MEVRKHIVADICQLAQDEVRQFASGLVADALKIAVTFHGGAFDPSVVCCSPSWDCG